MHWSLKALIVVMLLMVIGNLALALRQMLSDQTKSKSQRLSMSHFIGRRLLFTGAVLLVIVLLAATGQLSFNPRPF